jgi:hypothetical protein
MDMDWSPQQVEAIERVERWLDRGGDGVFKLSAMPRTAEGRV